MRMIEGTYAARTEASAILHLGGPMKMSAAACLGSALLIAACASAPVDPAPSQVIHLKAAHIPNATYLGPDAFVYLSPSPTGGGWTASAPSRLDITPIAGVRCEARNDRGRWELAVPGTIEVVVSTAPLELVCRHESYRDFATRMKCVTPAVRSLLTGAMVGSRVAMLVPPAGLVIAPAVALGALVASGSGGADGGRCFYGGMAELDFQVVMQPR